MTGIFLPLIVRWIGSPVVTPITALLAPVTPPSTKS
jgi:hypothetical protein